MTEMEVEVNLDAKMVTPKAPIDRIAVGERFRKDLGDIKSLADSINEVGLLHPIVVDEEYNLIAGRRRLAACKSLGWKKIPIHVVLLRDLVSGELHENIARKDFNVSEMVAIKRYFGPEVKDEAKKRQEELGRTQGKDPSGKFPEGVKGQTRDVVAKFVGVSGRTLEKAEDIVEAAEADPETFGDILRAVDSGKTSIHHAYTKVKRRQKHEKPPPLPEGIFDVIYADPPWSYYLPLRGAPDAHYPTMSIEEICAVEVPAAEDAVLFLWATNPHLEDAFEVLRTWGFGYVTNMAWEKDKWGTGYYFRGQHELLLVAKMGEIPPPVEEVRPSSVLYAPVREHSRKPEEVYEIIEKMYPNRRYLELFARNPRENWTSWGLEI